MDATTPNHDTATLELWPLVQASWGIFTRQPAVWILGLLAVLAGGVLTLGLAFAPLLVGYIRMIDAASRDGRVELVEVVDGLPSFGPALATALVSMLVVVAATPFVVLPGVIVAIVWAFALWFVALRDQGSTEALASSWRMAREHVGSVLLLLLCVTALGILGSVTVVGWLVGGPVGLMLMTLGFQQLTPAAAGAAEATGEPRAENAPSGGGSEGA